MTEFTVAQSLYGNSIFVLLLHAVLSQDIPSRFLCYYYVTQVYETGLLTLFTTKNDAHSRK